MTTVLSPFNDFSGVPPDVLEHAKQRGTLVHRFCHAYALGFPILEDVPSDAFGFFYSFRTWFDTWVTEVRGAEVELTDPVLGFIGHLDLICRIRGDSEDAVVDYKTPANYAKTWGGQMAAYRHLANKNGFRVGRAIVLRLDPRGLTPTAHQYGDDRRYLAAFIAALTAYSFFK